MQIIKNQILSVLNQTSSDLNKLKLDEETYNKYVETIQKLGTELAKKTTAEYEERLKQSPKELISSLLSNIDLNTITYGELEAVTRLLETLPISMLAKLTLNLNYGEGYFRAEVSKLVNTNTEIENALKTMSSTFVEGDFKSSVGALYSFMEKHPELNITKEDIQKVNELIIQDSQKPFSNKKKKQYIKDLLSQKAAEANVSIWDILSDYYAEQEDFKDRARKYAQEEFPQILELYDLLKATYAPFTNKGRVWESIYEIAFNYEGSLFAKDANIKFTPSVVLSHELGHYFDNVLVDTNPKLRKAFRDFSRDLIEMAPDFADRGNNTLQEYVEKGLLSRGYNLNNYHEVIPDVIGTILLVGSGNMTRNLSSHIQYMNKLLSTSDGNLSDLFEKHLLTSFGKSFNFIMSVIKSFNFIFPVIIN